MSHTQKIIRKDLPRPAENTAEKNVQKTKKKRQPLRFLIVIGVMAAVFAAVVVFGRLAGDDRVQQPVQPYFSADEIETDIIVTDETKALAVVEQIAEDIGIADVGSELVLESKDTVGGTDYYRFSQVYQGIPVLGRSLVISADAEGRTSALTCNYAPVYVENTQPQIDAAAAQMAAVGHLAGLTGCEESGCSTAQPELYIYTDNGDDILVWAMQAQAVSENCFSIMQYIISAENGEVISAGCAVEFEHAEIELEGQLQKQINVPVELEGDNFQLIDTTRGITVYRPKDAAYEYDCYYDLSGKCDIVGGSLPSEENTAGSSVQNFMQSMDIGEGVDAMKNVASAYDFFKTVLGRDSFDDKNGTVAVIVDVAGYNSYGDSLPEHDIEYIDEALAIYNGSESFIAFPKVDNQEYVLSAWLDTAAHEYTHLVTNDEVFGLHQGNCSEETASLKEAYSDIFGELVEQWVCGETDWIHSDNLKAAAVRNMYSPGEALAKEEFHKYDFTGSGLFSTKYYFPSHYSEFNPSLDYHINSTIISHAAYLMNVDTGDEGAALDFDQLAHLWYGSLYYLHADADFAQCRKAVELSAQNMLKAGKLTEKQVARVSWAFGCVGVGTAENVRVQYVKEGFSLEVFYNDGTPCKAYTCAVTPNAELKSREVSGDQPWSEQLASGTYSISITLEGLDMNGAPAIAGKTLLIRVIDQDTADTISLPYELLDRLEIYLPIMPAAVPETPEEPQTQAPETTGTTPTTTTQAPQRKPAEIIDEHSKSGSRGETLVLTAVDANGGAVWKYTETCDDRFELNETYYDTLFWVVNDGIVYINNADNETVTALDYDTGAILWRAKNICCCPVTYAFGPDGTLYIGAANEMIGDNCVAISRTGEELWRIKGYDATMDIDVREDCIAIEFELWGDCYTVRFDFNGKKI